MKFPAIRFFAEETTGWAGWSKPDNFGSHWQVFSFFLKKPLEISINNAIIGIEGVSRKKEI